MTSAEANEIIAIWNKKSCFVRFVDGNIDNCRADNLEWCLLVTAMENIDWKVDWDADLSEDQIDFVKANSANFAYLFGSKLKAPRRN